ncbi:MAG: FAD-binding oxidoreductase [Saprospiraceae bacterium]|nr:FAD-binding oxidoreductase [Saprospiraceae bacterium]
MQSIDYLIVGQGVAGTLMAHFLLEAQQSVVVIDNAHPHGATKAAAGIINPITGRRYVKSWRVEELIPFAASTYQQIEQKLGIQIFYPYAILRALFNEREENDWWRRSTELGYEKYILEQAHLGNYQQHTLPAFGYGELRHAAQVQIGKLANAYRNFFWSKI